MKADTLGLRADNTLHLILCTRY